MQPQKKNERDLIYLTQRDFQQTLGGNEVRYKCIYNFEDIMRGKVTLKNG
jgi:hypothetical protein